MNIDKHQFPDDLPVWTEDNFVLYPFMIVPIFTDNKSNIKAVDYSLKENKLLIIVNKKKKNSYYDVGVIGHVMRKTILSDGKIKILFQGISTGRILAFKKGDILNANVDLIQQKPYDKDIIDAITDILKENITTYSKISNNIPKDLINVIFETKNPYRLSEIVASSIRIDYKEANSLFIEEDIEKRLTQLINIITKEISSFELKSNIRNKAFSKMEKHNKEYLLKEQLREIHKELDIDKTKIDEVKEYKKKLKQLKPFMYKKAYKEIQKQINRYASISNDGGSESSMIQNYIEVTLSIPFNKHSSKSTDIKNIKEELDNDHYSLKDAKDRILEHFAVKKFLEIKKSKDLKGAGNILCFVGPPGVGKTSLANSIALALKRKLIRISLGGVEDVNELRGHRRTYVGAMCGRITQSLIDAKTMNPVIVLDEIDKLGSNHRGDPSSAFLEILDPEQNNHFRDHYLNFEIDLSKVLFIATANDYAKIPYALRDRLESIFLHSYTPQEKFHIAKNYLLPQEMKKHSLSKQELKISDTVLKKIIDAHTREAGVRSLRRQISKICRKCIKIFLEENKSSINVSLKNLSLFLDDEKFDISKPISKNTIGIINGLAWTPVGGDLLKIESMYLEGKGAVQITGNLGNVMKESTKIALSVAKKIFSNKELKIGIKINNKLINLEGLNKKIDLHIHVPEGATPKDGPSAGAALACAIVSLYSGRKIDRLCALTGELNLNGDILAIGGLKEKLIAAFKAGIKTALIPKRNFEKDLKDIPDDVKNNMDIIAVSKISEVIKKVII
jgi:ATP-dependent Lon protease